MKIKTRPWFDGRETIRQISALTPDHFRIDADWNVRNLLSVVILHSFTHIT